MFKQNPILVQQLRALLTKDTNKWARRYMIYHFFVTCLLASGQLYSNTGLYGAIALFVVLTSTREFLSDSSKLILRLHLWPLNKLLYPFKTNEGWLTKQLSDIEATIQPDEQVQDMYMSKHGDKLTMTSVSNDQDWTHVYYMRMCDVQFERRTLERDGSQLQNVFVSDGHNQLRIVLDPHNPPEKVSQQLLDLLINKH